MHYPKLTDNIFFKICNILKKETGISLSPSKKAMVQARVGRRIAILNVGSFEEYLEHFLLTNFDQEKMHFISILTTNVSRFFREPSHLKRLLEKFDFENDRHCNRRRTIRIWSAGCGNGQEPYSIAMFLLDSVPGIRNHDVKILGTDIDFQALNRAAEGIYSSIEIQNIFKSKFFRFFKNTSSGNDLFKICDEVKSLITFKQHNLFDTLPVNKGFDVIFCRNVVIYFRIKEQCVLWPLFSKHLNDDGVLFLGHSERIPNPRCFSLKLVEPTTYVKV